MRPCSSVTVSRSAGRPRPLAPISAALVGDPLAKTGAALVGVGRNAQQHRALASRQLVWWRRAARRPGGGNRLRSARAPVGRPLRFPARALDTPTDPDRRHRALRHRAPLRTSAAGLGSARPARVACKRARPLVRRPPLRRIANRERYDWRRAHDGPWVVGLRSLRPSGDRRRGGRALTDSQAWCVDRQALSSQGRWRPRTASRAGCPRSGRCCRRRRPTRRTDRSTVTGRSGTTTCCHPRLGTR
jgi:hypothetical protein